ncbi:hypothetical protein AB4Z10_00100 [Bosea sp. RAF48]|uniref:hypothetical protein n=1 Tax=Bosea sp. RAF48 TaxID=3237480 RepID=UPI003F8E6604
MSDDGDKSVPLNDAELDAVAGAGSRARTTISTFSMVGGAFVKLAGSVLGNEGMTQHGREMIAEASARLTAPAKKT